MQRIVRILKLKDHPALIEKYKEVHTKVWPEVVVGIRVVGISRMDIYLYGNTAVMILELPDAVDAETAFSQLAALPRQEEWEEFVSRFQQCNPGDTSSDKWHDMTQIFKL